MEYATFEKLHNTLLSNKGKIIHQIWFGTIPNKKAAKKAAKAEETKTKTKKKK